MVQAFKRTSSGRLHGLGVPQLVNFSKEFLRLVYKASFPIHAPFTRISYAALTSNLCLYFNSLPCFVRLYFKRKLNFPLGLELPPQRADTEQETFFSRKERVVIVISFHEASFKFQS